MNLFTDDHPETTLHGLGFSSLKKSKDSIQLIENHFNQLSSHQNIPGYPKNLKPDKFLKNKTEVKRYYNNQKMTRVIALLNRAQSIKKITKNKDKLLELEKSITLFKSWVGKHKITYGGKKIPSCCHHQLTDKQCYREKDKKIFQLPRKFSKSKCRKIRGFTMRSSCAPYKGC